MNIPFGVPNLVGLSNYAELTSPNGVLHERFSRKNLFTSLYLAVIQHADDIVMGNLVFDALQYVTGPFVGQYRIIGLSDYVELIDQFELFNCRLPEDESFLVVFDHFSDPKNCYMTKLSEDPVLLKDRFAERYTLGVRFLLGYRNGNFELRWVHFRGNMQLVPLNNNGRSLYFPTSPDRAREQGLVQYTHAGHLFAILQSKSKDRCSECKKFSKFDNYIELDRIIGLYLVPAVYLPHNDLLPIIVSPTNNKLFNFSIIRHHQYISDYYQRTNESNLLGNLYRQNYLSTDDALRRLTESAASSDNFEYFRTSLKIYWEFQRKSQIQLLNKYLPLISFYGDEQTGLVSVSGVQENYQSSRNDFYKKITLPHNLHQELKAAYLEERKKIHQQETFISMVFNQDEAPTYFVPLQNMELMRQLENFIVHETSQWLNISSSELEITSSYAFREYSRDSIIRWHVDPIETQPITAIIHIADSSSGTCTESEECWELSIAKGFYFNSWDVDKVVLAEGEVLLIQSGKIPHARLIPSSYEYYTNAFVHLAPKNWNELPILQLLSRGG